MERGWWVALITISLVLSAIGALAQSGAFERVDLAPITPGEGVLRVVDPGGNPTDYFTAELERLPTWSLATATPWEGETRFEGILLSDLLARHGLSGTAIEVIAENDYVTRIPSDPAITGALLVATRADGQPIGRRERGPIYFVAPADVVGPDLPIQVNFLVWMAAEIRPAS